MHPPHSTTCNTRRGRRGQTIVEFALILPVLVLLMLVALDFGRAFLGWVSLNNAARVGANYAALHPNDDWGAGTDYQVLMTSNMDAINCVPNPDPADPPVFGPTKEPGDFVTVNLSCDFTVLTPVITAVIGDTVTVSSSAVFPISEGCLADCPTGPPAPPPPPPADNCRTVPDVVGMSVAGARLAWESAGFVGGFVPATGDDTRTVATQSVTEAPNTEGCTGPERFYDSRMSVTLEDIAPTSPGCITVPNLTGITVGDARAVWSAAGFTGTFLPTNSDARVVVAQVTDPPSDAGDCIAPVASVVVSHGPAWAPPPPPPCRVPSFVNTSSATATTRWTQAGFDAANIDFSRGGTFTILSQSLVGGQLVSCSSDILLSHRP